MTSDQLDAYAERLAHQATELAGVDDAPGVLLQALTLVMLDHHSHEALVFCLERSVCKMRDDLAASLKPKGTVQ
jgi:hypothetical protein